MTPGHDPKVAEQIVSMRELSIILLFEIDPQKAEALVAKLRKSLLSLLIEGCFAEGRFWLLR